MKIIEIKTTFTKYRFSQWISKLPGSFEINWVRQYLVNLTSLVGRQKGRRMEWRQYTSAPIADEG